MGVVIDGKKIAQEVREKVRLEVVKLSEAGKRSPGLAVVLVGSDAASQVYVRNKTRACERAGMHHIQINLDASTTQKTLQEKIAELNADPAIDGILVQLPLPNSIDEETVLRDILPEKDVDGFHPENMGKLVLGQDGFVPCTPLGIMKMLEVSDIDLNGKEVVVIGRSNIVGKPMALLAVQKASGANGTVTICHSRTPNIADVIRRADVVVAAIGKAGFVTKDMVKEGAVVIDVGINRREDGSLCGDVDYAAVEPIASAITPVPGGVGPMTIAMLLSNTLDACTKRQK